MAKGKQGNILELHENIPSFWDAWNIGYTENSWVVDTADSVTKVEKGPIRSVLRIKKSFLGLSKANLHPSEGFPSSFFVQDIVLWKGVPRVDVEMTVDWWEDHTLLKVSFPFSVKADRATYEIPFGSIERPTQRNAVWEKARFEVPVHRWADLSGDEFGVSLLNDSKYGMDIKDNVMRLTLLTSALWPDPMADRGKSRVVYAIYPHKGTWKDADTVRQARQLNLPLVAMLFDGDGDDRVRFANFCVDIDAENAVIESIKKAEDSEALILRIVEHEGKEGKVSIVLPSGIEEAAEVDFIENEVKQLPFTGNTLTFSLSPFAIKSVRIKLKKGS